MPRKNIYLTEETEIIWDSLENGSAWVQEKLYEFEEQKKALND